MLTDEQRHKQNAAKRAKYRADPEVRRKIYETNKAWVEANKDKHRAACREAQRRYREKPGKKEYYAAKSREYRSNNPGKHNEAKRKWYAENREYVADYDLQRRLRAPIINLLMSARWRCRRLGIPFDLTREWAEETYTGFCSVTGLPIILPTGRGEKYQRQGPFVPSLDRIDPKKGYTQENCRIVIWAYNRFKGTETDEEIVEIARAIVAAAEKRQQSP